MEIFAYEFFYNKKRTFQHIIACIKIMKLFHQYKSFMGDISKTCLRPAHQATL